MARPTTRPSTENGTRRELLALSRKLLQRRGFSGFSFQDLADRLRIRKASIHYHFATKTDLLWALIDDYDEAFGAFEVETKPLAPIERIRRYFRLFRAWARDDGFICPFGALVTEDLPAAVHRRLADHQDRHRQWLLETLHQGRRDKTFRSDMDPKAEALLIGASIQGALQIARLHGEPKIVDRVLATLEHRLQG